MLATVRRMQKRVFPLLCTDGSTRLQQLMPSQGPLLSQLASAIHATTAATAKETETPFHHPEIDEHGFSACFQSHPMAERVRLAFIGAVHCSDVGESPTPAKRSKAASKKASHQNKRQRGAQQARTIPSFATNWRDNGAVAIAHIDGMAGGFPVSVEDLSRYVECFSEIQPLSSTSRSANSSVCSEVSARSVASGLLHRERQQQQAAATPSSSSTSVSVLDELYWNSKRRGLTVHGMNRMIRAGVQWEPADLATTFHYHVRMQAEQSVNHWFDITESCCRSFHPSGTHGTKVLTAYGVAVSVGVAMCSSAQCPLLYWHPTGQPAAELAPLMHAVRNIEVGKEKLEPNGPRPDSSLVLVREDASRYMNAEPVPCRHAWDSRHRRRMHDDVEEEEDSCMMLLDRSKWLTHGLFGCNPGDTIAVKTIGGGAVDHVVEGVSFCPHRQALEVIGRDTGSGDLRPLHIHSN